MASSREFEIQKILEEGVADIVHDIGHCLDPLSILLARYRTLEKKCCKVKTLNNDFERILKDGQSTIEEMKKNQFASVTPCSLNI